MFTSLPDISNDGQDGEETLAAFLRRCRERLEPAALGIAAHQSRTPGLQREEMAQRAHANVTWYTWLEQGRGGTPSADLLARLARALVMIGDEREHLFLLAQHRPPAFDPQPHRTSLRRLQAVVDAFDGAAAYIKNHRWDVQA